MNLTKTQSKTKQKPITYNDSKMNDNKKKDEDHVELLVTSSMDANINYMSMSIWL